VEEEKKRIYTIVTIAILAGVLVSCIMGALAGGLAGFLVGQRQGEAAAERALDEQWNDLPELGQPPEFWQEIPVPEPEPEEEIPHLDVPPVGWRGALVLEVIPGTPADQAGLTSGDIILAIDRTPINRNHDLADVIAQYEPGDLVTLRIWRNGQDDSVRATLSEHPDNPRNAYLGIHYQMMVRPGFKAPSE
jgi:membrane-associated protease RseP (regulator of RpoE activity)